MLHSELEGYWLKLRLGDQVFLGYLAVGGNFVFSLIIVAIFIGLGRACRLGGF